MSAVLYQLMPPLSPEEYSELTDDIRANGIQVPVIVDEDGVAIDGHHRQRIAEQLGIDCPTVVKAGLTDAEKRTMALNLNLHRRHLSRDQKRQIREASLKADPQLSDREHARRTGTDHKTVAADRERLEKSGEFPHFDNHIDPRTGEATQPATKLRPASQPKPEPESLDEWRGRVLHDATVNGKIVKLTGPNSVANPGPVATGSPVEPAAPRRTPLPEQFFNASYDLCRKAERVLALTEDDRFPQNREKLARKHRNELLQAITDLQSVIDALGEPAE